ncbi:MAG TPA: OmpA family protein [Saprospiraceae bacterium]|nr:OmpA family protein [Saprospiraceae bacterium]
MQNKLILLSILLLGTLTLAAQGSGSSKSKSKDRFREKDDRRYPVKIDNPANLNQPGTDYAPVIYDNGILFVSARGKKGPKSDRTGETFEAHYLSTFDRAGNLVAANKFEFNASKKSDFHEGPVAFTRDFKTAFVTRNNNDDGVLRGGKNGKSSMKIYQMSYGFPDWTPPIDLPFNSDDYSCMHPSLSVDEKWLFFASDMPGGSGGFDLYAVERLGENQWGEPINLGPGINTEKQDLFPFMSQYGSLFFASNGRSNNLGGMDIYFVNNPLEKSEEKEVVNLGEPFNTPEDDYSFITDPDGHTGYFASNRKDNNYGKTDIYYFSAPRGLEGTGKPETNRAKISVIDDKTGLPLQGAEIRIFQPTDDGFISGNNDFYDFDYEPDPDRPDVFTFKLVRKDAKDMGKPDLYANAEGYAQTDFTRYRNYLVMVSAKGYTSRDRFMVVDSEDELNLSFKMKEAPPCLRAGGVVLTTEHNTRIANASIRFEHRATGAIETARTTRNGEFDVCLSKDGEWIAKVELKGFRAETYRVNASRGNAAYDEIRLKPLTEGLTIAETMPLANGLLEGSVFILDKIFYEKDKATLNQGAVRHLEAWLQHMSNYPEMEIEITAHTDVRGDEQMNMVLTEVRAKNAKTYLVAKGINEARIKAVGKGETQPRNHCVESAECSDEEHQQNNRLEIKIKRLGPPRT